jgi:four helix bundle protein
MQDPLERYPVYQKALAFYDHVVEDTHVLMREIRGREIARQMIRAAGSISANIEEGYGRGSTKEFVHFLRIARGSARESKGWYRRARGFLPERSIEQRQQEVDEVIALLVSMIRTLEKRTRS